MKTSVIILGGNVSDELQFPIITKFGIVENAELGVYIDAMANAGHNWTAAEVDAFKSFISSGEEDGWLDKIGAIYPMFGDVDNCLAIPLVQRFTSSNNLTIGSGTGYDIAAILGTTWDDISYTKNDRYVGINPLKNRYGVVPFHLQEILDYYGIVDQKARIGLTSVVESLDNSGRWVGLPSKNFGVNGTLTSFYHRKISNSRFFEVGVGSNIALDLYTVPEDCYVRVSYNGITTSSLAGGFDSPIMSSSYREQPSFDSEKTAKLKLGIGGVAPLDDDGDWISGGTPVCDVNGITKWISIDNSFNNDAAIEAKYRSAIKDLFVAIGK